MIIGNVKDARQMLSDPDWKAEDQREALARTSGGNNDDNDNQGGDMPLDVQRGVQQRKKPRTETRRRSQPRSRKMIIELLKILKSKRIPQKESVLLDQC